MIVYLRRIRRKLSTLSGPAQFAIFVATSAAIVALLFWLLNEAFYYIVAKSYVDELSQAYSLNRGFTKALVWGSFAILVLFCGWSFSLTKRKRIAGQLGILFLLIAHALALGLRDPYYDVSGKTEKCYVLTRDGIKILNHVGVDPDTGRECKLLTPQMTERYNAYKNGNRPQRVAGNDPAFFDPATGEAVVWYASGSNLTLGIPV